MDLRTDPNHKGQLPSQGIAERYDIIVDFSKHGIKPGDKLYFVNTLEHQADRAQEHRSRWRRSCPSSTSRGDDDGGVADRWINGDPGVGKFLELRVKAYAGRTLP